MTPERKERIERRRVQLYAAVKNNRPDLYTKAIEIGHLATVAFSGADETRRAAIVEIAAMELAARAAEIDVDPGEAY